LRMVWTRLLDSVFILGLRRRLTYQDSAAVRSTAAARSERVADRSAWVHSAAALSHQEPVPVLFLGFLATHQDHKSVKFLHAAMSLVAMYSSSAPSKRRQAVASVLRCATSCGSRRSRTVRPGARTRP